MDYEELKTFILYDARPQANYQFVMIKTLLIVEHATKESIAKDLQTANPKKSDIDFRQVPVYGVLVNRGIVKESDGMYTLKDFDKLNSEQKKELVMSCNRRIEELEEKLKIEEPKYWKIAPGEKAEDWEFQKKMGIIAIGWNDLGDLTGVQFEDVHERILDKYQNSIANISPQFKNFLNIKRGDLIIANKGMSKIVGIGKVTGGYQFRPEQKFSHVYPVEWFWTKEKEIPKQSSWMVTVLSIPTEVYKTIISASPSKSIPATISTELEELIQKFDADPQSYETDEWKWYNENEREKNHSDFIKKFPLDQIENLNIDDYIQGKPDPLTGETNRRTFCYILEHSTAGTGSIAGSTSDKFGIYYDNKKTKDYIFKKTHLSSENAFKAVKHEIHTVLEAGKQFESDRNWEKLSDVVDLKGYDVQRHVRSKLLSTYFPKTFLPIHSKEKIDIFLDFFEIPKTQLRGKLTLKQSKLLEIKESHPTMKKWDTYTYSVFLWYVILPIAAEKEEEEPDEYDNFTNEKLLPPTPKALEDLRKELAEEILIADDKIEEIISALIMGKNVLLTGAVGTGKTHLATLLPEIAWKDIGGYYSMVFTATADWTTQDVIGGIYPKIEDKKILYDIQRGCVSETVANNWVDKTSDSKERKYFEALDRDRKLHKFRGVWLVIDEFNRANIDRALGQLFTALEYKKLQIPTTSPDEAYEELIIPEDYRIIGTLNTADKHYLNTLSDALKRRFAIIELPIPDYTKKDKELYYVVRKSIKNLEFTNANLVLADEIGEFVRGKGDPEVESILDTLYTLMSFLRVVKPLGTALLISMFRFMIVHSSLELVANKKLDDSLDKALVSSVIPQIEDLPYWTLKVIRAAFCSDLGNFFKSDPEIRGGEEEKYYKDFLKVNNFIQKLKVKKGGVSKRFLEKNLNDEDMDYLNPWNAKHVGKKPTLPNFKEAITQIISEKGISEESELEDV